MSPRRLVTLMVAALTLLMIGASWSAAHAQRDTTVCTAFRTRTAANGAIQSTSVTKVACGGTSRVDTVPGYTQYFYWHPVVVGSQVLYQIASRNNDPTPPPSITLPVARVDTLRLRDTLAFFPSITPAYDSVRFTLQPYHASPIWSPASIALKIDRYFYWWPVVGTDSIRFELRDGGAGASHPPSIAIPRVVPAPPPVSNAPELPRVFLDTRMPVMPMSGDTLYQFKLPDGGWEWHCKGPSCATRAVARKARAKAP